MTAKLLIALIRAYQLTLSPFVGGACRFQPSCSVYALEAVERHGAWRGSLLAARRLSKCHPFGASGFDPVPDPPAAACAAASALRASAPKPRL
jgi:putative membrane protein insertion efficiency factor